MKHKLFIEVLPRLETCYVFIRIDKKIKCLSLNQQAINLSFEDGETEEISVNFITFMPNTLSSLEFYDQTINFRVQIEKNIIIKSEDHQESECVGTNFKPDFEKNCMNEIKCRSCKWNILNNIKFKRILPLPSGVLDRSDYFCHDHSENSLTTTSLNPKDGDCFYGHFYILVKPENNFKSPVVQCEECFSWLGTYKNSTLKLWNCSTSVTKNSSPNLSNIAFNDFRQLIKHICETSFYGTIKIVLESNVEENKTNYLLIWILDCKLMCLTDKLNEIGDKSLTVKYTNKLLYLFQENKSPIVESWLKNINITTTDVAKQMLLTAVKIFNENNSKLPLTSRKINDMYLSYLDPIL